MKAVMFVKKDFSLSPDLTVIRESGQPNLCAIFRGTGRKGQKETPFIE